MQSPENNRNEQDKTFHSVPEEELNNNFNFNENISLFNEPNENPLVKNIF